jgi:hypothetical protein
VAERGGTEAENEPPRCRLPPRSPGGGLSRSSLRQADLPQLACCTAVMVPAARAALIACLIAHAAPSLASPLATRLQDAAGRCFEDPAASSCDAVWDLSAALKEQADKANQLRCYTSVLSVEAMVSMAKRGARDPGRQQAALGALTSDCP